MYFNSVLERVDEALEVSLQNAQDNGGFDTDFYIKTTPEVFNATLQIPE
jgi:hypothetical protein